jgi:hypothetical protein
VARPLRPTFFALTQISRERVDRKRHRFERTSNTLERSRLQPTVAQRYRRPRR